MVTQGYVTRCMGKWVICHTRQSNFIGRLEGHGGNHLAFWVPRAQGYPVSMEMNNTLPLNRIDVLVAPNEIEPSLIWYGVGNVLVPLAAIVGLTIIGASAIYW